MTRPFSTDSRKSLANTRGRLYLDHAKTHMQTGDVGNALALAEEGLRLTAGPFYISVRDELSDMADKLRASQASSLPN